MTKKRKDPSRSPLRNGPLLVRSLTYVMTGATEPWIFFSEVSLVRVGSPHALSPSLAGFPSVPAAAKAADLVKTQFVLYSGSRTLRLRMTPNSVPDLTSASCSRS